MGRVTELAGSQHSACLLHGLEAMPSPYKDDGVPSQDLALGLWRHQTPQTWEHSGPNFECPGCWLEGFPRMYSTPKPWTFRFAGLSSSLESVCPVAMVTDLHRVGPTNTPMSFRVRGLRARLEPSWAPSESWGGEPTLAPGGFGCSWLWQCPSSLSP